MATNGVIKRAVKEVKYAQIDNDLINNRELSFKALGIITYILSKPTDWEVYISDLCRDKDGEKSVRAGLKELIEKKYMQRYRVYDMETGKVHHWETLVSETPFADEELISSVKEKYLKDSEGKIINKKIKIKNFERNVPVVVEREVLLLSQNVHVENLHVENAGQQILIYTNTKNNTKTNSSINSKGENAPNAFLNRFEAIIGKKLGVTTLPKFKDHIKNFKPDLIEAILVYAEETNARTYQWFEDRINDCIRKNITTGEEFSKSINDYREEKRKAKNKALKAKDEAKKEKEFENKINENILEDMIKSKKEVELNNVVTGESVNELKELLKNDITDVQFNTWIAGLDFKLNANELFIVCPNTFTKDILVKRYEYIIKNAVKQAGLNVEIEYVVAE